MTYPLLFLEEVTIGRGYDEETEEYVGGVEELSGAIADLTKTASTPGGISLFSDDAKTEYKSTKQLLGEIASIYNQLTDKNQAELLEKLAGKRNGQALAAVLGNWDAVEKAMENMENSAGSADKEMSIVEQSISYKLNNLKQDWVGVLQTIGDTKDIGNIIVALTSLSDVLGGLIKHLGLFGTLAAGGAGFAAFKNVGGLQNA